MRYDVYYLTDKLNLIKENITKEELKIFAKSLNVAEASAIRFRLRPEREDLIAKPGEILNWEDENER